MDHLAGWAAAEKVQPLSPTPKSDLIRSDRVGYRCWVTVGERLTEAARAVAGHAVV